MYKYTKRFFDIFFSLILLIILFPLFLVIILLIFLFDGNPIFFKQKRCGLNNKIFTIYKFRTLKNNAPSEIPTNNFKDLNKYLTNTGFILRRISLDELPQIINILLGHMSFIGPRPLLYNQLELISQREIDKSNTVKPGITGLAQITKIARENDSEKLKLDKIYLENFSFNQDFKISIKTIIYILNRLIN